jgi:hypothetical protein
MISNSKTLNVCENKGNKRVWIEGAFLSDNGITRGMRVRREVTRDSIVLHLDSEGKQKIAGTDARPIIDLCGAYVTAFMGNAARYTATIKENKIVIERA